MRRRPNWSLLLALAAAPCAAEEGGHAWPDWIATGAQALELAESYGLDLARLADSPSADEWTALWRQFETSLQGSNLEDVAWVLPSARNALHFLNKFEEARPYADWLKQRLDYLEVADTVVQQEPEARRPVIAPPAPHRIVPPPPERVPAPPVIQEKMARKTRSVETWKKKLAGRPPPRNAAKHLPVVKGIFRELGMPEQLVWLAEVESTFDPLARSPVGAVGLFQLMPPTAQRFGLSLRPQDQRKDPARSARAAASYLRILHREFRSWPLAFAAYNAGEGRVGRLSPKGRLSFDHIAPRLPLETQMYVPKILALIELREGKTAADIPPPRKM